MRWMEYLSRFDFGIQYVRGSRNTVADSLSRYHQSDSKDEPTQMHDYVNADLRLDPEGEDLPWGQIIEIRTMSIEKVKGPLKEASEDREIEAARLTEASQKDSNQESISDNDDPILFDNLLKGPELTRHVNKGQDFIKRVKSGYAHDPLLSKVALNTEQYL